jgi:hypothetical protein
MTKRIHIPILCMLLIVGVQRAHPEEQQSRTSQLVSAEYSDSAGRCHLAIKLAGNPQFSANRLQNEIRILFAKTDVPPAYDGARLHFSSGLITRAYIDRAKGDSIVVAIGLKANTGFQIEWMHKEQELRVSVFPDSTQQSMQDSVVANAVSMDGHRPVIVPIQTICTNSLVPEARPSQREQKNRSGQSSGNAAVKSGVLSGLAGMVRINLISIFIAVGVAVVGTVLTLLLMRSFHARRSVCTQRTFAGEFSVAMKERAEDPTRVPTAAVESSIPESPRTLRSARDVSSLDLARKYGRGLGEINLSFALKARQGEHRWVQKVKKLAEGESQSHDNLRIAKEFGVGRGEVDLTMLFHHLKTPKTMKEELA